MLETYMKSKLPKGFSYPLKLKDLNEAFSDVSFPENFEVWFSGNPNIDETLISLIRKKLPYKILSLDYVKHNQLPAAVNRRNPDKIFEPKWKLYIYPVESSINSEISEKLKAEFLERFKLWFLKPRTEIWLRKRHSLQCILVPEVLSLTLKEK